MPPDFFSGLFWLLLPVAAASGWYLARRTAPAQAANDNHRDLSTNYFQGLDYLLDEQPDKAIEVFIQMLEVGSETVETHLALGNLFRRRGEVDRAIRIHQNLITRPSLSHEQRCLAVLELAMDYLRSGLLDRAETLFKELLDANFRTPLALKRLLEIYQQEQDWESAIDCARELQARCGEDMSRVTAQFYCERGEQLIRQGDNPEAANLLKHALDIDPGCVRASLMRGRKAAEAGDLDVALRCYKQVEHQDPDFLVEAMRPLMECYKALGRLDEFADYLRSLSKKQAGITPVLVLSELIANEQGVEQAISYIGDELLKRPSVRGLDRLIEYSLIRADGASKRHLEIFKQFTSKLLQGKSTYLCRHCGFRGKMVYWQCPGCKYWNTVRPIHGIEGE